MTSFECTFYAHYVYTNKNKKSSEKHFIFEKKKYFSHFLRFFFTLVVAVVVVVTHNSQLTICFLIYFNYKFSNYNILFYITIYSMHSKFLKRTICTHNHLRKILRKSSRYWSFRRKMLVHSLRIITKRHSFLNLFLFLFITQILQCAVEP